MTRSPNLPNLPNLLARVEKVIAALDEPSIGQFALDWHDPRGTYATKPRPLLDEATTLLRALIALPSLQEKNMGSELTRENASALYWRNAYEELVSQTGRDLNDGYGIDPRKASPAPTSRSPVGDVEAWRPTHIHADGGLYRFIRHCDGRADAHEPWSAGVLYQGADHRYWWTGNDRWFDRFTALSPVPDRGGE